MLEKLDFAGVIRVMILPVNTIGLLCTSLKLAYVFDCLIFLSVSR